MKLWIQWWTLVKGLRPAFSRESTFLWFCLIAVGFTVRADFAGITSIIRALGLKQFYYDRLMDFFRSSSIRLDSLTRLWVKILLEQKFSYRIHGRIVLIVDGLKVPKAGRKMPSVKSLHQSSESNSKPEYIMGHSCQAATLLMNSLGNFFATPLACRIHEGVVSSNRDTKTLMDKIISLIESLGINKPFYVVADAYYAGHKIINWLNHSGQHLVTRVKTNAVAYLQAPTTTSKGRGRPPLYGEKIKLRDLFQEKDKMMSAEAELYGEKTSFSYRSIDLLWKPVGILIRFVLIDHPSRGKAIFMTTDLTLSPLDVIIVYSLRFKIEVSFKQALRSLGVYAYHFWSKTMKKIKRKSKGQYVHKETKDYRIKIQQKIFSYHIHIQVGLIVQGILQCISMSSGKMVFKYFGSWLRTIRPNVLPSETVVAMALRNTLPEFLQGRTTEANIEKFILKKVDSKRAEGQRMIA